MMLPGVYIAYKKNKECYYRASITYRGKHISLGSYPTETDAYKAYLLADDVLSKGPTWSIDNYPPDCILSFHKWVVLVNLRDHRIYFKNPIYLRKNYFIYYIDQENSLKFDVDDLFYYAHHKIIKRGGHLFVSDYGMQVNLQSRYGIKNYAVAGRDYLFRNGDETDYRYSNVEIINRYHGVNKILRKKQLLYEAKIHINGDYIIGRYQNELEAAMAYNKAVLLLQSSGFKKRFPQNYIDGVDEITYASMFHRIRISKKLLSYAEKLRMECNEETVVT